MRRTTNSSKWLGISLFLISLMALLPYKAIAQLTQYKTASTGTFHHYVYDNHIEGRVYACTATEALPRVYKSEDHGKTWKLIYEFTDPYRPEGYSLMGRITDLRSGPDSDKVYFNIENSSSSYSNGLYEVNHKTGEVKHYELPNAEMNSHMMSYDIHGKEGNTMILHTTYSLNFVLFTEIFYTTDKGENWERIYYFADHDYIHIGNVAFSPTDPSKIFMPRAAGPVGVNGGLYVSEDAGKTWKEYLEGHILRAIAFNPSNPDEMYIGTFMYPASQHLFRSKDGGVNWEEIEIDWVDEFFHTKGYIFDIKYDPKDPNRLIVLEENQIIITEDDFETHENIRVPWPYATTASINPFNTDQMYICVDGVQIVYSPDWGRTRNNISVGSTGHGCIDLAISKNSNQETLLYYLIYDKCYQHNLSTDEKINIAAEGYDQIIVDPTTSDHLFLIDAESDRLSFVDFNNHSKINPIPTSVKNIQTIVRDPESPSSYWIARDNAITQINITNPDNIIITPVITPSGEETISGIFIPETNPQTVYISKGSKVYKSINKGSNWQEKTTGLGNTPIKALAGNPLNNDELIIATGNSLYITKNAAESWSSYMINKEVDKIAFSTIEDGVIAAGTYSKNQRSAEIIYSTNKGDSWQTISAKELHYCLTESMDFCFTNNGTIEAYIASPDMGCLKYNISYECTQPIITSYPYLENFENGGIPVCWTQETVSGKTLWQAVNKSSGIPATTPDDSEYKINFNYDGKNGAINTWLITSQFDLSELSNPSLSFWYTLNKNNEAANLQLYYRNNQDDEWQLLTTYTNNVLEWSKTEILLPESSANYQIAFQISGNESIDLQIDNVSITETNKAVYQPVRHMNVFMGYGGKARITWVAPEKNYDAIYNVYRDNIRIAEKITATEYLDSEFGTGEHTWSVVAVYNETESEKVTASALYSGLLPSPQDLQIELSNSTTGDVLATLTWKAGEAYDEGTYNVYRNNELIASAITSTYYMDSAIPTGEHEWCITSVYGEEESENSCRNLECNNRVAPIRDLSSNFDTREKAVNLTWEKPGALPEDWISYGYEPAGAFGFDEPAEFAIAVRWSPEDLKAMGLDGAILTELTFVPWTSRASYYLRIWTGGDGSTAGTQVYNQYLRGPQINPKEWNTITMTEPHIIDASMELWIGCEVVYTGGDSAFGCDEGISKNGKSNMINLGTGWTTLTNINKEFINSWCIGGRFTIPEPNLVRQKTTSEGIKYNIYRDGELVATTQQTSYSEKELPIDFYNYCITALHTNGSESVGICTDIYAGNLCDEPENIAVEMDPDSEKCSVNITWNAMEPGYEMQTIFYESFDQGIPEEWQNKDKDGDGITWKRSGGAVEYFPTSPYKGAGSVFSEVQYFDMDNWITEVYSPDNWLITPAIKTTGKKTLTYYVAQLSRHSSETYYEVLVSTTGTDYENFTKVFDETLGQTTTEHLWYDRTIDLSEYNGDIYIAFRHLNSEEDQVIGIQLDEVSVAQEVEVKRLYNIYRDDELIASNLEETSYTDNDFTKGTYEWCVRAVCREINGESDAVCAKATCTVDSIEEYDSDGLRIYPNPTSDKLFIESQDSSNKTIQLINTTGKIMYELLTEKNNIEIDMSLYPNGIYFININGNVNKVMKR